MQVADDMTLLQEYAGGNSESAFTALVSRHINFVYSSALRQVRDPHLAEEITQAVFIILARKAGSISRQTVLSGWLFKTVRFTASAQLKSIMRRRRREQEAQMSSAISDESPDEKIWQRVEPVLDEALSRLSEKDRQAVLLRYFENKSLAQVGGALAVSEDTARKRVGRAVEKLRQFFVKRGVVMSVASISGALAATAVRAAPAGLAAKISTTAVKGSAVTASTLTLVKGALKLMSLAKLKLVAAVGTAAILAVGATVAVEHAARSNSGSAVDISPDVSPASGAGGAPAPVTLLAANTEPADKKTPPITMTYHPPGSAPTGEIDDSAWDQADSRVLATLPPAVILRPTHFSRNPGMVSLSSSKEGDKLMARAVPFDKLARFVYGVPSYQLALPADAPTNRFDALLTVPGGSLAMLQEEIRKQFGLVPSREMREGDVLVVKVKTPDASGLKASTPQDPSMGGGGGGGFGGGGTSSSQVAQTSQARSGAGMVRSGGRATSNGYSAQNQSIAAVLQSLQGHFELPLYDETGLTGNYDITLKWEPVNGGSASAALQAALLDQLGLELTPGRARIEMLVLRKE